MYQRQEQVTAAISGRKINNYFTCTVKEVRRLSPQLIEQHGRQRTFETDSFKQILTKRSGGPTNKENVSTQNKVLRKIKQQAINKQESQENKKKPKSNSKRTEKKGSAVSLTKLFERNRSTNQIRKKQTKSVSPSRDLKDYRSGPVQKKNYLSNNVSKTNKQVMPSKSEKSLTDRGRNPLKSLLGIQKKEQKNVGKLDKSDKNDKKEVNKSKKCKNNSKVGLRKTSNNMEKTQSIAKQFDSLLLKQTKQKTKKKSKKVTSKDKTKKSKQKKVIVSHNNSKNFISKNKINSYFSDESPESGQKGILSTRYQPEKPAKRERLSFQPFKKKGKSKQKAKTEALSPQKSLANKNEAAIMIQKMFRGYLTRKYIKQFKRILLSVITIQRMWRGYKSRKQSTLLKEQVEKARKQELRLSKMSAIGLAQSERKMVTPRENELANLLQQILNEKNVKEQIKNKISNFLKKQQKSSSSKNNSAASHMEQQMKSEKRFFDKFDKDKHKFGSPLVHYSPKLEKSDLRKSPEVMIESLLAIKQFQRQKLITNAKMQLQGLESLTIKNIFSPRTRDHKKIQIHKKLEQDLQKFDESMSEVIKSCKQSEDIVGPIKPFSGNSTPERPSEAGLFDKKNRYENSPTMKQSNEKEDVQKMNSSQRKLQDLSMQLLQYYEQKTQSKGEKEFEKLDCSYGFIQQYLLNLFEFLRQLGQEYHHNFVGIMRTSRNLQISSILKNLFVLTEDSDEDQIFKLPMYKYLEKENEVLSRKVVEQFNNSYKKLQRHQLGIKTNLQDTYLIMIIDAVNEALNMERPYQYIFTEAALLGKSNRMKLLGLSAMEGLGGDDDNESQFSLYFANSMNHIYKWAHFQCGRTANEDAQEGPIMQVNEMSLKNYLKFEAVKSENYYDELLEIIVEISNIMFDQIISEQIYNLCL